MKLMNYLKIRKILSAVDLSAHYMKTIIYSYYFNRVNCVRIVTIKLIKIITVTYLRIRIRCTNIESDKILFFKT